MKDPSKSSCGRKNKVAGGEDPGRVKRSIKEQKKKYISETKGSHGATNYHTMKLSFFIVLNKRPTA